VPAVGRQLPHGGHTSDRDLAFAAADGDRLALECLLRRHFDYVYAVCRRILRDPEDAADAQQEALFRAARRIARFEGRAEFRTWMHRIAVNAALDLADRRGRYPPSMAEPPEPADPGPSDVDRATIRLDVDVALQQLAEPQRTVVVLRDLCDLEYDEIAERLDIPIGTVRSRIARGRSNLAASLGNSSDPAGV